MEKYIVDTQFQGASIYKLKTEYGKIKKRLKGEKHYDEHERNFWSYF